MIAARSNSLAVKFFDADFSKLTAEGAVVREWKRTGDRLTADDPSASGGCACGCGCSSGRCPLAVPEQK
jgi:hypothetical protein